MNLFEMKQNREAALAKAEGIIALAETAKRALTTQESQDCDAAMTEVHSLTPQIERIEKVNTLRNQFPTGRVIVDGQREDAAKPGNGVVRTFTKEYRESFCAWAASKGKKFSDAMALGADQEGGFKFPAIGRASAASYEGSNSLGGYAVPSMVDGQIIPLAPQEFGVQKLATVVPTSFDMRFPRKAAHGTAAVKTESGGGNNAFGGTDATIEQFTLSAFMVGHLADASWELLQDVPVFQSFIEEDILLSLAVLKESYFVTGTGSGQPQGLIGNVGAGVVEEPDTNGNVISINATYDVQAALNAIYHTRASWLMTRATSIVIRKAQTQANLFAQVWNRIGNQDFLHGYPVEYSSAMPSAARGNTPVLFGDFKSGYIIGERGGAGVNVKILDQPKASLGLLEILGYQRIDGRVRRSEAIQPIYVSAS